MQITIEDISPVEKRVDFELPWIEVAPRLDKAYGELRREVRLKGFRPGKAPRPMLERLYRHQVEDDVARELIEMSIGRAINESQIQPVAPPTVDKVELKAGEPFKFSARVEVRSPITPKDYTGVPLTRRRPRITDDDIEEALQAYRRRLTELRPIEGRTETAAGDMVIVELHGKVGEHHVHKLKGDAVPVDLDDESGGPLPGLAARLRGLPVNAVRHKVTYRIADDTARREMAGLEVDLEVTIKEAREKKVPALDDEMAKDTGEADSLDGLRAKLRQQLIDGDKLRIERELQQALVKEVVNRNPFPVAPALVDRHAQLLVNRAKAQLYLAGVDIDASGHLDEQKMKQDLKDEAEEEARATILLQAIAEREGITVSDADVQKRIAEIAAARRENAKKLRAEYERDHRIHGVRLQIQEQKVLDKLMAEARIADEDPDRLIVTPAEHRAEMEAMAEETAALSGRKRKR